MKKQLTASEMGKRGWAARKKKYGKDLMKKVRNGQKLSKLTNV